MSAGTADKLRAGAGANQIGLADLFCADPDGHSNVAKVHSYHGIPDIKANVRADKFNGNRVLEIFISCGSKGASGLGLGHNANYLEPIFLGTFTFNYNCTV